MAGHVFRPSASELQEGVMVVEYSVVQDRYDTTTGPNVTGTSISVVIGLNWKTLGSCSHN